VAAAAASAAAASSPPPPLLLSLLCPAPASSLAFAAPPPRRPLGRGRRLGKEGAAAAVRGGAGATNAEGVQADADAADESASLLLEWTRWRLDELRSSSSAPSLAGGGDDEEEEDGLGAARVREYLQQPAARLQAMCRERGLPTKGRKPDLARRLARWDRRGGPGADEDELALLLGEEDGAAATGMRQPGGGAGAGAAALPGRLSPAFRLCRDAASAPLAKALERAGILAPTGIQAAALPLLRAGRSAVLHAETGSGKTLAYLLPFAERLWRQHQGGAAVEGGGGGGAGLGIVLTPTLELAAQVAGVARSVCPPGSVRLVAGPAHLLRPERQRRIMASSSSAPEPSSAPSSSTSAPRLIVGTALDVERSLFGAPGLLPAPPTPRPLALHLLQSCRYLVLDEVDRLLLAAPSSEKRGKRTRGRSRRGGGAEDGGEDDSAAARRPAPDRPGAVVAAAAARHSLGKAQVVAASATVGRPLRRELARVLGLPPEDCPPVVLAAAQEAEASEDAAEEDDPGKRGAAAPGAAATTRAVTVPQTVRHYVYEAGGGPPSAGGSTTSSSPSSPPPSSPGALLAAAHRVLQRLPASFSKVLLVLPRGFGISPEHAAGALAHFGCRPRPRLLVDALRRDRDDEEEEKGQEPARGEKSQLEEEDDDGTVSQFLIRQHRRVSGIDGAAGGRSGDGYLLVAGEESVRGLHLEGLDAVVIVGRPGGADEYAHIAGRTGRAGRSGAAISVVRAASSLRSWESVLGRPFEVLSSLDDVARLGEAV
jgi:hypothetical protein